MTRISRLPWWDQTSGLLNVVVETPRGSRNKYKHDHHHDVWKLRKLLPLGMAFPCDFGFVPGTRAEDGDEIDVLVFVDEPTFPGCVLPARLIGVLEAEQTDKGQTTKNDRLFAVVETPYNPPRFQSIDELSPQCLDEVERFFVSYNEAEGRQFRPLARKGPERAREILETVTRSKVGTRGRRSRRTGRR